MSQFSSSLIVSRREIVFYVGLVMKNVFRRGNVRGLIFVGIFFEDFIFRVEFNSILTFSAKETTALASASAAANGRPALTRRVGTATGSVGLVPTPRPVGRRLVGLIGRGSATISTIMTELSAIVTF